MSTASGNGHRIVVGVDGSQASQEALVWAVHQAEQTGASIDAVIAWHNPVVIGGMPYGPLAVLEQSDFGKFAETTLTNSIRAVVAPTARSASLRLSGRGTRPRSCSTSPTEQTCWLWAAAATADSPRHSSVRSASIACTTRAARW